MNVETVLSLEAFKPRPYQIPIVDALLNKKYKRVLAILPRRAGKDIVGFNIAIRKLIERPCMIYYVFPTFAQGKKILWDGLTNDGQRILDFLPSQLIESSNSQEMKIRLKNGSLFQIIGSDTYDTSLIGTNPQGCIFSEYSLQDPRAYQFVRPILTANQGWALFLSTPRGKNHLWELYNIAQQHPDWYCLKLTVEDTQHIPIHEIQRERSEGIMSEDLIQQEYYCSFELGVEGAIYAKTIDRMRVNGQIGMVPWESHYKTNTAWDIGRDTTSIIFYQCIGQIVRVIDYYEKAGENLDHFVKILAEKPYHYGKHFFPHDMRVTEWAGPKFTRVEKARQLGIKATIVDDVGLEDGIEHVRATLSRIWIDQNKCDKLLKALENYRRVYDAKRNIYSKDPLHNWASHGADAMRYLCISLPKATDSLDARQLDKRYQEALYGSNSSLPPVFRDDLPNLF
jgi:phage terminase large subunit